ncbi:hypothetical protein M153_3700007020 [Pseudoloma neurophilia]|uniref:Zinc-ribbon 15 domain-containing protein n=1 Tax=Pseudoloma neurophilia TaxID=146866 RepID=A0A0R0M527_9MICR|nr:hypothetical protein M153_3700007020 [Pseudoloma neurophilia]
MFCKPICGIYKRRTPVQINHEQRAFCNKCNCYQKTIWLLAQKYLVVFFRAQKIIHEPTPYLACFNCWEEVHEQTITCDRCEAVIFPSFQFCSSCGAEVDLNPENNNDIERSQRQNIGQPQTQNSQRQNIERSEFYYFEQ